MEVPDDWFELLRNSRKKPNPFIVIEAEQQMVKKWNSFFKTTDFVAKCPFAIQPVKEIICRKSNPRLMTYNTTYNGYWLQSPIKK